MGMKPFEVGSIVKVWNSGSVKVGKLHKIEDSEYGKLYTVTIGGIAITTTEDRMLANLCPRCRRTTLLEGRNALSRRDNKTEICSDCGTKEALADADYVLKDFI
jgi:predicted RNA-binding Zn-ribbon protein involved in translation (DUF1610 family)